MTSQPLSSSRAAGATSDRHVAWMFELVVQEGREAEFRALMAEMSEATERDEPGTLDYEWYLSDDGRRLHLFERYADAAMTHLATFGGRYMRRFFAALVPRAHDGLWRSGRPRTRSPGAARATGNGAGGGVQPIAGA